MKDIFKLGEKLKHLRHEHNYKQESVADDLGVAASTYSDYERGLINVPSIVVVKAAEYYKKELGYFYTLRGPESLTVKDQIADGHEEQLRSIPADLIERMLQKSEERWAAMTKHMMDFMERISKRP